jgi:hypothetical protein
MIFDMFEIKKYDEWGKLVKSWVRGTTPSPKDLADFKAQVLKVDPSATFPARYTDLELVQTSSADPVLRIRLPPLDLLKQAEYDLKNSKYPMPLFYSDLMFDPGLRDDTPPPEDIPLTGGRMVFHNHRVGEYTIKFCG